MPNAPRAFHPIAGLFPLMTDAELAVLADDIQAHGLHMRIVLDRAGTVVDGRNRHRALQRLGWDADPAYYTTTALEGIELVQYVVSLNLHRRHLNESQRAMIAAELANLDEGRPETAPIGAVLFDEPEQSPRPAPISQSTAAELLNVSRRAVQRAAKVRRSGSPALVAAVEQGCVAVSAAAELVTMPVEEQEGMVAKADVDLAATAKALQEQRRAERAAPEVQTDPPLTLNLNGPAAVTATDFWLARLLEQVNRLPPLVGLPLIAALAPAGDEALSLYADIVGMMDAVVARLTAPPAVVVPPAPAVRSHHKPRKPPVSAPAPGQVDRQGLIMAQRAHFGTEPFTWKALAARTELSYVPLYQGLGNLVKKGVLQKLTTDTYQFTTPEAS
jgi:hypothetical protein